jgi:hypothetical protein
VRSAEARVVAERHGWDPNAFRRLVAEAPPIPDDARALLRAAGFPARGQTEREAS